MVFSDIEEARRAYENFVVELQAKVRIRVPVHEVDEESGESVATVKLVETTVGRALLSSVLPEGLSFEHVNRAMTKKAVSNVINACYRALGLKKTVVFADRLMYTGFRFATISGISIGVNEMVGPESKEAILDVAEAEVKVLNIRLVKPAHVFNGFFIVKIRIFTQTAFFVTVQDIPGLASEVS